MGAGEREATARGGARLGGPGGTELPGQAVPGESNKRVELTEPTALYQRAPQSDISELTEELDKFTKPGMQAREKMEEC